MSTIIYHNHHIIPKHAGGTNAPDNLIQLTIPEHAEAHRKLYEEFERWQDKCAWQGLAEIIGKDEIIKFAQSQPKTAEQLAHPNFGMRGKKHSEESIKKMSDSKKGKSRSTETRKKISDGLKGKTHSDETKKKISESHKKRHAKARQERSTIIHVENESMY